MRRTASFRFAIACAALGLVLAVLGGSMVASHQSTAVADLDRSLETTAGEKAALVETELERIRALALLTARIPPVAEVYAAPGSHAADIAAVAEPLGEVTTHLVYLSELYPNRLVEASYVDVGGAENTGVVRGEPLPTPSLEADVSSWPSFDVGLRTPADGVSISMPFRSRRAGVEVVAATAPVEVDGTVRAFVELELSMRAVRGVLDADVGGDLTVSIVDGAGARLTSAGSEGPSPSGRPSPGLRTSDGWRYAVRRIPSTSISGGPWFVVVAARSPTTLALALDPSHSILLGLGLLFLVAASIGLWRARARANAELEAEHQARQEAERLTEEARRAEDALRAGLEREQQASEQLRALDQMRNAFLQAVSHELRTPLASVLGYAVTLGREDVALSDQQQHDFLERLEVNARKLAKLLTDLLDVDRLARGVIEPKLSAVDLRSLCERVVDEVEFGPRSFELKGPAVEVLADAPKVERIVENLLANAVRHTPEESRIWLRVEPTGEGAVIVVEDDGAGVPDPIKTGIFKPFHQGPNQLRRHEPGSGIGLSLVSRFAELHGGKAWVQDREGGGASFRVFLPTRGPDRASADAVRKHATASAGSVTTS